MRGCSLESLDGMKAPAETPIKFDTVKFRQEEAKCRASQIAAFESLGCAIYKKAYGLKLSAPAEFWRLALGKTTIDECIREIQNSIQDSKHNPSNADWQRIMKLVSEVAQHSSPMTNNKWQTAKQEHKNDFALIQRWVARPNHPRLVQASLCFYSWDAIAELVYLLNQKTSVPSDRRRAGGVRSIEAERIKKQCERLGLIQSELRLIRNVNVKSDGTIECVPFKQFLLD